MTIHRVDPRLYPTADDTYVTADSVLVRADNSETDFIVHEAQRALLDSLIEAPAAVTLDWLLGDAAEEAEDELQSAIVIALATDRRAVPDDVLPNPDSADRRGWWGDTNADVLFDGWPIGSRLWLLQRVAITGPEARGGSTVGHVQTYLNECLQPFVDAQIASHFTATVTRTGDESIAADVTIFRGNLDQISLRFADLWSLIQP